MKIGGSQRGNSRYLLFGIRVIAISVGMELLRHLEVGLLRRMQNKRIFIEILEKSRKYSDFGLCGGGVYFQKVVESCFFDHMQ